ncbi:MoxR family ATPase [Bacillus sp. FJAT-47783]|uniref:ATP-binding protein n=1 Tax=Bacillus sp. FJAT-47783 TaxID=2922712 RepID=UPI001FACC5AF|nr:MoxR family ATPase [Bacillus sp. FJAT-47783]
MNHMMKNTILDEIQVIINERKAKKVEEDDFRLIGEGGYIASDNRIIEDAIISLVLEKNILLKGPTGSGKTKLAETLSATFSTPMHSINCSVDLDAEALLGYKTIQHVNGKQTIQFVEGPVIQAMKKGHFLYIDEINMAKPETLPILNGVLDYRKTITNPFTGEVIKAKKGFGVIAAINEGYVGTVPLNEALKNRFVMIDVPYIHGETLKEVINGQSKLTDPTMIEKFVTLSTDIITLVQNGHMAEEAASIRALLDTCDLAVYLPPKRAVERGIVGKLDDEREKAAIRNIAETIFE